jgi:hypothetical protein
MSDWLLIAWLRRQPFHLQVLWLWLMMETVKVVIWGEMLPAFWQGPMGE